MFKILIFGGEKKNNRLRILLHMRSLSICPEATRGRQLRFYLPSNEGEHYKNKKTCVRWNLRYSQSRIVRQGQEIKSFCPTDHYNIDHILGKVQKR